VDGPARLVFVDESGANTKMTRWCGRSPGGQRLVAPIPHGHYQTSTLIAAIRLKGPCAPWLFEGAMNGEMFLAWVRQGLVPALQKDDLVIMDNLATHKIAGVGQAIETVGPSSCICRPIRRISTPSKTYGARSSKSCAAPLHGPRTNSLKPHAPPLMPFQPPTAAASFYTPVTLYDLWKRCSWIADGRV
jgi:hypothetical protein